MGLEWDASLDEVESTFEENGLSRGQSDGDAVAFNGRLLNQQAMAVTIFYEGRLAKVNLIFDLDRDDALDFYSTMKEVLVDRYGEPKNSREYISDEYEEYPRLAFDSGDAVYLSAWQPRTDSEHILAVHVDDDMDVQVTYESPLFYEWSAERKQREADKF
jgi:hypothetical protein